MIGNQFYNLRCLGVCALLTIYAASPLFAKAYGDSYGLIGSRGNIGSINPALDISFELPSVNYDLENLATQQLVARWAQVSAIAAIASAAFTFLGLLLISGTLYFTRTATQAASGMLHEARETTEAARKQVSLASEHGVMQLRAYVLESDIDISSVRQPNGHDLIVLSIHYLNSGQTPGHILDLRTSLYFCEDESKIFSVWDDENFSGNAIKCSIGPSATVSGKVSMNLSELKHGIMKRKKLIAHSGVKYKSMGQIYESQCCYVLDYFGDRWTVEKDVEKIKTLTYLRRFKDFNHSD